MAQYNKGTGSEAGILSRQGELFTGGAAEASLQKVHPAARFLAMTVLLLGISFCRSPLALVAMFTLGSLVAVASFLNLRSIYKLVLVPVVLLALPSWLVAVWWYDHPVHAGALFFLRTLATVTVASVMLHSIGLRRIGKVMQWFRVPQELRQMWNIMISQVAGFSELVADMALARSARTIRQARGGLVRRQVGRQMGILFSRTYQRGNQLAFAMEARQIKDSLGVPAGGRTERWNLPEYSMVILSLIVALIVGTAA